MTPRSSQYVFLLVSGQGVGLWDGVHPWSSVLQLCIYLASSSVASLLSLSCATLC